MREFTIKSTEDIKAYFMYLMVDLDLNFHPDNSFYDYIKPDGTDCFTPEEADHLDEILLLCIEWCYINKADIYDIAMDAFNTINK